MIYISVSNVTCELLQHKLPWAGLQDSKGFIAMVTMQEVVDGGLQRSTWKLNGSMCTACIGHVTCGTMSPCVSLLLQHYSQT